MAGQSVKVAVVQRPPVLLDREATLKAAVAAVSEVADAGAGLVVFPEAYLPGYPAWIWSLRPGPDYRLSQDIHAQLLANSVDLSADDLAPLQAAAAERGVVVVCGIHEREGSHQQGDDLQHPGHHRCRRRDPQPAPQAGAHQPRADGVGAGRRIRPARDRHGLRSPRRPDLLGELHAPGPLLPLRRGRPGLHRLHLGQRRRLDRLDAAHRLRRALLGHQLRLRARRQRHTRGLPLAGDGLRGIRRGGSIRATRWWSPPPGR